MSSGRNAALKHTLHERRTGVEWCLFQKSAKWHVLWLVWGCLIYRFTVDLPALSLLRVRMLWCGCVTATTLPLSNRRDGATRSVRITVGQKHASARATTTLHRATFSTAPDNRCLTGIGFTSFRSQRKLKHAKVDLSLEVSMTDDKQNIFYCFCHCSMFNDVVD